MTPERWRQIEDLYHSAMAQAPERRAAFLAQLGPDDAGLRSDVLRLLDAHEQASGFLTPANLENDLLGITRTQATMTQATAATGSFGGESDAGPRPRGEGPGSLIGPYLLMKALGQGGMGAVYLAEQQFPIRRKVALKIVKPGMDSERVIARFESERQALAMMDHGNIAKVFDAGTTATGRPFFVMELVEGVTITQYSDANRLDIRRRLELFQAVCDGIQHAHQKAIVHRDIKPGNVLVAEQDGRPIPKIIDFGIAKAIDQTLTDSDVQTQLGMLVGTLEYMSPEQADLGRVDIDTRSDIYSLGVLLYELLTGATPLDTRKLRGAGYLEALRVIREEDPPLPSARLTASRETLADVAVLRRSDAARLARAVSGELDWIVGRALEKNRAGRYQTANALSRDVHRYLAGEPVEAGPPTTTYRLRKFAWKYRAWLATAAAFAVLLLAAVAVSTLQAIRATRAEHSATVARDRAVHAEKAATTERDRAVAAEQQAQRDRGIAVAEQKRADTEAATARAVNNFLQNDLLAQASAAVQATPDTKPDPDLKVRTALDRAAARIDGKFPTQPEVEASIRQTVADAYYDLGLYGQAQGQLERALDLRRRTLGEQHRDTLVTLNALATVHYKKEDNPKAAAIASQALEARRRTLGDDHPDTLDSMFALANVYRHQSKWAESERLFVKVLAARKRILGVDHPGTLDAMDNLGLVYRSENKLKESEALFHQVFEARQRILGPEHPSTLEAMNNVAMALGENEALELYRKLIDIRMRVLGPEHARTLQAKDNTAKVLYRLKRYKEAEALANETLPVAIHALGENHTETEGLRGVLNLVYEAQNRWADMEKTARAQLEKLAPDARETAQAANLNYTVGRGLSGQNKFKEALEYYSRAYEIRRRLIGEENPAAMDALFTVAMMRRNIQQYAEAEPGFAKVYEYRRGALPPGDQATVSATLNYGINQFHSKKYFDAEKLSIEAAEAARRGLGDNSTYVFRAMNLTAAAYIETGRHKEAADKAAEFVAWRRRHTGLEHRDTLTAELAYADLMMIAGQYEEGRLLAAKVVAGRAKLLGAEHIDTIGARIIYGNTAFWSGRHAEAEQIFRQALDAFRRVKGANPEDTVNAVVLVGMAVLAQGRSAEAEPLLREGVAGRVKLTPDSWTRYATESLLGASLAGQSKLAEAEPLLISGYEGFLAHVTNPNPIVRKQLDAAGQRIVQFYVSKPDLAKAAQWRQKLGTGSAPLLP